MLTRTSARLLVDGAYRHEVHCEPLDWFLTDSAIAAMLRTTGTLVFNRLQAAAAWPGFT